MTAAELKSLVVCDLVESTRLLQHLGDVAAAEVFRRHDAAARAEVTRGSGREIDKSDGFLLLFDRPLEAVRFACAYHAALQQLASEFRVHLDARVGIHLGEVLLRENRPEVVAQGGRPLEVEGLAKVVAARLMALARPRQTLLTAAAYEVARGSAAGGDSLDTPLEWRAHGRYALKGITDPVEVCEVGVAGFAPLAAPEDGDKARRVGGGRPGVLVLPFEEQLTNGAEHLSDGLTDEVITSLSAVRAIRVIARGAALQLKGTAKDRRVLGRELHVEYLLEGKLRRSGEDLRITAQLYRVADDEVLWAHRYTGKLVDLFTIEEHIARHIAEALHVQLSPPEERTLAARPIPDATAYEYYLQAKQHVYRFTPEALDRALEYLHKGSAILGDTVPLLAALGTVYWQYVNAGVRPDPAYLDRARECAERIFVLAPDAPEGHRLLGLVEILARGDQRKAAWHLRRALAANPNDPDALYWLSGVYAFVGHPRLAAPLVERLLEIDPLTPLIQLSPAFLALFEGDTEGAIAVFQEGLARNADNPAVALVYGQCCVMGGRREEAHRVFTALTTRAPDTFFARMGQCFEHALRGDAAAVAATLTPEMREAAGYGEYAWMVAQCCALAGAPAEGLDWLAQAVANGFCNYPLLAERDPALANLRGTARFAELLATVKERWRDFDL